MNKQKLLGKIACWCGYCLFAGYSAYMTAKSIAMSFEMNDSVLVVFIFVFIVALLAGWCLTLVIGELQNRFNPNRMRFLGGLFGFLLFWGVSFATNVHYMFFRLFSLAPIIFMKSFGTLYSLFGFICSFLLRY